jgi:hypothetical protein
MGLMCCIVGRPECLQAAPVVSNYTTTHCTSYLCKCAIAATSHPSPVGPMRYHCNHKYKVHMAFMGPGLCSLGVDGLGRSLVIKRHAFNAPYGPKEAGNLENNTGLHHL